MNTTHQAVPSTLLSNALSSQKKLTVWLRKSGSPDALKLTKILAACSRVRRCRSAACPVCGISFQMAATSVIEHFIGSIASTVRGRMHAATIVPNAGCIKIGMLKRDTFLSVRREVLAVLQKLDLPPTIVGIEASCNEDLTENISPYWCVHAHLVGVDWLSLRAKRMLRNEFPASRKVKRPTFVQELDDSPSALRYPFKAERYRRVTQWSAGGEARLRYRETKSRMLRPPQAIELALVEHQFGFHGRLAAHRLNDQGVQQHLRQLGWPFNQK